MTLRELSGLAKLKSLQYLEIDGAPFMPKSVWIDDLKFLRRLPNLRGLSMAAVRFRDAAFVKSFKGLGLECLDFWVKNESVRNTIIESLPNLRYGRILDE